jgi:hypothetical protein
VIEYEVDETGKPTGAFSVKVLQKGLGIFKEIFDRQKENANENERNGDQALVDMFGGERSNLIRITATKDDTVLGGVKYTLFFSPKEIKIKQAEIDALAEIHTPTPEEILEFREVVKANFISRHGSDERMSEIHDWMFYGYNLEKLFPPQAIKQADDAQPEEEPVETFHMGDTEEATPPPAASSGKNKRGNASASTAVAEPENTDAFLSANETAVLPDDDDMSVWSELDSI